MSSETHKHAEGGGYSDGAGGGYSHAARTHTVMRGKRNTITQEKRNTVMQGGKAQLRWKEKHNYAGRKNIVTQRAVMLEMQSRGNTDAEEEIMPRNQSHRRRKQSRVHAGAHESC